MQIKSNQVTQTLKRKTMTDQVNELLEKTTHDELKKFVLEQTKTDSTFTNQFLLYFARYNSDESKAFYEKQLISILQKASDRYGIISWKSTKLVADVVNQLLDFAEKQFNELRYKSVINICTAVMEQLTNKLQQVDDSHGYFGDGIETANELLLRISQEQLPEEIRKQLIKYCFTAYEKRQFSGWDWHLDQLRMALSLLKTESETARILSLINQEKGSDYEKEKVQYIQYDILLKTKGKDTAEEFLKQHIANPDLRRKAIEEALNKRDFGNAISIAWDGVNHDKDDKPGLAMEWYDWLLKTALAQKNTEKIVEYSRLLFIDNFRHEQDYYSLLKKNMQPEKWKDFIEGIINDLMTKKRWTDKDLIASIFIRERWWDRLLELVRKTPTLTTIERYEKYLSKEYTDEIVALYADAILAFLKHNIGRNHYQDACRYIRKISKLGAVEIANEIIAKLRVQYPNRRALMDELSRI